jgi:rubrerythrin
MESNPELKFWYIFCDRCSENDVHSIPFNEKEKPTQCPICNSAEVDVYEQLTLF